MPVEVGIWKLGGSPERVEFIPLELESKLESAIVADLSVLAPDLMLIGRQVATSYGKFIDVLAIDPEGNIHVLELKRHQTAREVVAQLLDYASWVQGLSYDDIGRIFAEKNAGKSLEVAFDERFGISAPSEINTLHKLYVVASELDASTERIIGYLASNYNVPINAVFFRYFRDGDSEFIARSWLIDPNQAEAGTAIRKSRGTSEPWNGRDYYVAFGESVHRDWEDAMRYGYVSAGGGIRYSRPLYNLSVGDRVSVCIPSTGYVGIGIVADTAKHIDAFTVDVDGVPAPVRRAPLKTSTLDDRAIGADTDEHFVRIDWIKAVPRKDAYWEKGMFANQNIVCKLTNRFTLEKLAEHFGLDGDS